MFSPIKTLKINFALLLSSCFFGANAQAWTRWYVQCTGQEMARPNPSPEAINTQLLIWIGSLDAELDENYQPKVEQRERLSHALLKPCVDIFQAQLDSRSIDDNASHVYVSVSRYWAFQDHKVYEFFQNEISGMKLTKIIYDNRLVPVFRFFAPKTGEHFFTLNRNEGSEAGMFSESYAPYEFRAANSSIFNIFKSISPQRVGLFRCYNGRNHFVTRDSQCEGKTFEGIYGYISTVQLPNFKELTRCYNSKNGDHFVTTEVIECIVHGYEIVEVLGFVRPTWQ